jgi:hypothetical protein
MTMQRGSDRRKNFVKKCRVAQTEPSAMAFDGARIWSFVTGLLESAGESCRLLVQTMNLVQIRTIDSWTDQREALHFIQCHRVLGMRQRCTRFSSGAPTRTRSLAFTSVVTIIKTFFFLGGRLIAKKTRFYSTTCHLGVINCMIKHLGVNISKKLQLYMLPVRTRNCSINTHLPYFGS